MSQPTRRDAVIAGHTGDVSTARAALQAADPAVRASALGALERLGVLDDDTLATALSDDAVQPRSPPDTCPSTF